MSHDTVFELASALAFNGPQPVGTYRFDLTTAEWWWSDEIYAMYGYERGEVVPTTELMLAHNHPDSREIDLTELAARCNSGAPFSSVHRILDAVQRPRILVASGQARSDTTAGAVLDVRGFVVDLTIYERESRQEEVSAAVQSNAKSWGNIAQAKGALMAIYGLDDEEAFQVLRHHSSITNVKVRDLATGVLDALSQSTETPAGERVDAYFAHPFIRGEETPD